MYLNKLQLIGRLTADPQLRYTASSMTVCTFSIATSFSYERNGERKENVEFHNCEAWDKLAESIGRHMTKGSLVYIEGRLRTESWDGECGKKHYRVKVVVQNCSFGPRATKTVEAEEVAVIDREPDEDDDVPF